MTERPILVYDDDCGFCTRSAQYIALNADLTVVGFSDLTDDLREALPTDWRECAHLVTAETIYSCGEAMERAFELTDHPLSRPLPWLRKCPGYRPVREFTYQQIAHHRPLVSRLTRRWL